MKLNWKIWLLIAVLIGSLLAIFPIRFSNGVEITSVSQNSTAFDQGLRPGMIITKINGNSVNSIENYYEIINSKFPTKEITKLTITTKSDEYILLLNNAPEIEVKGIDKTRLKTGLDLSGGARALVVAEEKELTSKELDDLISITSERLNVYGLKDVQVKSVKDLSGRNYMLIEIAGSTPEQLRELITRQGKFEAKIGNETVFTGGDQDITYVARMGRSSGIYGCDKGEIEGYVCIFRFSISLSPYAAERHAGITSKLGIDANNSRYLDKKLDLYLDDRLTNSLYIGKSLQGSATTQIMISGSGTGTTRKEAYENATHEMKQMQTVLITGSLPFKLAIEKIDTISPQLGKSFIGTIFIAGIAAIIAVGIMIFLRYRKIKLSLAILFASFAEVLIILGVSALIHRSLDLPAIAGIIAAIGTGVDDNVIILDESQMSKEISLKERVKRALYIILGTYVTTVFALMPLMWAGAGLLKGFAITTIIGISAGVFITRPAFSEIVKLILKD